MKLLSALSTAAVVVLCSAADVPLPPHAKEVIPGIRTDEPPVAAAIPALPYMEDATMPSEVKPPMARHIPLPPSHDDGPVTPKMNAYDASVRGLPPIRDASGLELKRLFDSIDKDESGSLSSEEVKERIKIAAYNRRVKERRLRREQVTVDFDGWDTNRDGFMAWNELEVFFKAEPMKWVMNTKEKAFQFADTNEDKKLSTEEYFVFLRPEDSARRLEWLSSFAQGHVDSVDKDGNGQVSWDEHWGKKGASNGGPIATDMSAVERKEKAKFASHDQNHDGQLNLEEYQALWLDAMRERMVDQFQQHDDDGDGVVTTEEFGENFANIVDRRDRNDDGVLNADDQGGRRAAPAATE